MLQNKEIKERKSRRLALLVPTLFYKDLSNKERKKRKERKGLVAVFKTYPSCLILSKPPRVLKLPG